jgi:hypothetical protein
MMGWEHLESPLAPLLLFLKAGELKHYSIGWMIAALACAPMTSAALLRFSSQRVVRLKMFSEFVRHHGSAF